MLGQYCSTNDTSTAIDHPAAMVPHASDECVRVRVQVVRTQSLPNSEFSLRLTSTFTRFVLVVKPAATRRGMASSRNVNAAITPSKVKGKLPGVRRRFRRPPPTTGLMFD